MTEPDTGGRVVRRPVDSASHQQLPIGVDAIHAIVSVGKNGFARDVLVDACDQLGLDPALIDASLDAAANGQLVETVGHINFTDEIHAANVAATLPTALAQRLHAALADAIGIVALDPARVARDVARHRAQSGDNNRAVLLLLEAAELHDAAHDYETALSCLSDAAVLDVDIHRRRATLIRHAGLSVDIGASQAAATWLVLRDLCIEAGDQPCAARAEYQLFWLAGDHTAPEFLAQAATRGAASNGWAERAQALQCIIDAQYVAALDFDKAALRAGRAHGDRSLEAVALLGMSISLALSGDMDDAITAQRSSISIAVSQRERRVVVTGRLNLINMLVEHLDPRAGLAEAIALRAYLEAQQLGQWQAETCALQASIESQLGMFDRAAASLTLAETSLARAATDIDRAFINNLRLRVALETGMGDMRSLYDETCALVDSCGIGAIAAELSVHELRLLAASGHSRQLAMAATALELPEDERSQRASAAVWMIRTGMVSDSDELVTAGIAMGDGLACASARQIVTVVSEVAAVVAARASGDVSELLKVEQTYLEAGLVIDAADVAAVTGAMYAAHNDFDAATSAIDRASQIYVTVGALSRLDGIARLLSVLAGASASNEGDSVEAPAEHAGASGQLDLSELLVGVPERDLRDFQQFAVTRSFEPGRLFFSADDENASLYVVRSGRVRLYCMTEDGKRLTIALLDPGAVFGENSVLGQLTAGLHAEADEAVVADVIPAARMRELMQRAPQIGLNLLSLVGSRLKRSHALTEQVAFWTVQQRVCRLLLDLDDRYGHPTLDGFRIVNRVFTHADIAEMVNARRETVGELFKQLRAAGTIEIRKRRIVLCDPAALAHTVN
ncbi:MAG: Crp/Fnr family transcriptional regulator [Thermoleophilia bacterium]|nr:Crp/Fnr family transcriptional regulator [Thermoleophilia bacterium]